MQLMHRYTFRTQYREIGLLADVYMLSDLQLALMQGMQRLLWGLGSVILRDLLHMG